MDRRLGDVVAEARAELSPAPIEAQQAAIAAWDGHALMAQEREQLADLIISFLGQ
jgi:hypothetical protein